MRFVGCHSKCLIAKFINFLVSSVQMGKEIQNWLDQANDDFDGAKFNFDGKKYYIAAFLCQQSVEKALKALLIKKTGKFPKIHDLTRLARLCNAPQHIIEFCAKINPAYTATRYPDAPKKYTKEECKQIAEYCDNALKWVKKNLS